MDRPEYPQRSQFFTVKFVRLLAAVDAAQEIGTTAAYFLAQIVHAEDRLHYRVPVRMWDAEIQRLLCLAEKQVRRVRQLLIDVGWLCYYRETSRSIGEYFVTIPACYQDIPDQAVGIGNGTAVINDRDEDSIAVISDPNQDRNGTSIETDILSPSPNPNPNNPHSPPREADDGSPSEQIAQVWSAYLEHHPRAKLSPDRRKLIARRLKDGFSVETLQAAIEGNHLDPFCCGQNDSGTKYHALTLILRDADRIERYAALADKPDQSEQFEIVHPDLGNRKPR